MSTECSMDGSTCLMAKCETHYPTRAEGGAIVHGKKAGHRTDHSFDPKTGCDDDCYLVVPQPKTMTEGGANRRMMQQNWAEERKPRKPSLSVAAAIEAAKAVVMEYGAYQAQWANGDVPQNGEYAAAIGPTLQAIAQAAQEEAEAKVARQLEAVQKVSAFCDSIVTQRRSDTRAKRQWRMSRDFFEDQIQEPLKAALEASSIAESGRLEAIRERDFARREAEAGAVYEARWIAARVERDAAREALKYVEAKLTAWLAFNPKSIVVLEARDRTRKTLREPTDTAEGDQG